MENKKQKNFHTKWKRCVAFFLAVLMVLTLIPATVYKADDSISLYGEATLIKEGTEVKMNLQQFGIAFGKIQGDNAELSMKRLKTNGETGSGTIAFCWDVNLHSVEGEYYACTTQSVGAVDSMYDKLVSFAYMNESVASLLGETKGKWSNGNYALAQALIWGYSAKLQTANSSDPFTDDDMADLINYMLSQVSTKWNQYSADKRKLNAESFVENAYKSTPYVTLYIWKGKSDSQPLVSAKYKPEDRYDVLPVQKKQSVTLTETVTINILKKDGETGNPLSGVSFDLYKDNVYVTTVTTDANGKASYPFTEESKKEATSSVYKYVVDYDKLSAPNRQEVAEKGYYTTKAQAESVAIADAKAKATALADDMYAHKHTYKAVETKTKEGYALTTTVTKTITVSSDDGSYSIPVSNFTFTNIEQLGSITITKEDGNTGDKLAGAIYGLYAKENIVSQDGKNTIRQKKDTLVATFPATDSNGQATLKDLYLGSYYVKEITAPVGYMLNDEATSVELKYAGQNKTVTYAIVTVTDLPQYGSITVSKEDANTGEKLTGAVFELYAKEDIIDPKSNEIAFEKDELVETLTTDESGTAFIGELPLGNYYIKEVTAPTGYVLNDEEVDIALSTSKVDVTMTAVNEEQLGSITITKEDIQTKNPLDGAEYGLYAKTDILSQDGTGTILYEKDELVDMFITGEDGTDTIEDLPLGKYYVKEITAPSGYVLSDASTDITLKYAGQNESVTYASKTVYDTSQRGSINAIKVDKELYDGKDADIFDANGDFAQGDATIEGAVYGLYAKEDIMHPDGTGLVNYGASDDSYNKIWSSKGTELNICDTEAKKGTLLATIKTDANGEFNLENLYNGIYYIKEIEASNGYVLDETIYEIDLSYTNQNEDVVIKDITVYETVKKQAFDILKVGQADGSSSITPLGSVEFTVKLESDVLRLGWSDAPVYDVIKTASDGMGSSIELPYGTYHVKETKTPKNYISCGDFFVTIKEDSREHFSFSNNIIVNKEFSAMVKAVKLDAETGKTVCVEGTSFKVKALTNVTVGGKEFKAGEYISIYTFDSKGGYYKSVWTTDENGSVVFDKKLGAGKYQLEEITAPNGYLVDTTPVEFEVSTAVMYDVSSDGETPIITVMKSDISVKGQIAVEKRGEVLVGFKNGKFVYEERALADAVFEIRAKEDILDPSKDGTILYEKGTVVETLTTGADGTATSKELPLGVYEVVEIKAPNGMVLGGDSHTVELTYKDQYASVVTNSATVTNERQKADIKVIKKDSETYENVAGAEITLYAKQDIVTVNGTVLFKAGDAIRTVTTDANGYVSFGTDLPLSTYRIDETKAPVGYVNNDVTYDIDATYKGQDTKVIELSYEFVNEPTRLEISKTDITTGDPVIGAELSIYPVDEDGTILLGECFATWITMEDDPSTEENEAVYYIERIPVGNYVLREKLAQASIYGYVTAEDIYFTVEDVTGIQKVEMKDDYTKLEISKTDITTGEPVIGAELSIYPADEEGNPILGECWATWITGEEPYYTERIPVGTYVLREVLGNASELGYVTAKDVIFVVADTGEIQKIEMIDGFTTVKINKVDSDGNHVIGAVLSLVPLDENGEPKYGETFATWITGEEPYTIERLPIGKYMLVELSAPEGFYVAESVIIEVTDTELVQEFSMVDEFILTDIEVNKVDAKTGKAIVSNEFKFALYSDKECTVLVSEGIYDYANGTVVFENLKYGTYYIKEVEAPNGYKLSSEVIEITINDELDGVGDIFSFTYENESTIKNTGDNYTFPYSSLISVVGLVILGFAVNKKRKAVI